MTLRITSRKGSRSRATLTLEGRVVAEWAALLERECSELLRSRREVVLDLAAVMFVDRAGVRTLGRLSRAGAEIRCRPGAVASVLEGEGIQVTQNVIDDGRRAVREIGESDGRATRAGKE